MTGSCSAQISVGDVIGLAVSDSASEIGAFRHLIRTSGAILIMATTILIAGTLAHVGTPQSTLMFGSLIAFLAVCFVISIRYGTM